MIILKGGLVIDPVSELEAIRDIAIAGEKIVAIEENIDVDAFTRMYGEKADVYDCSGKIIGPGLVDVHVHFRDPGFTYKEDIYTGAKAAARGGVTSVVLMANTKPVVDNEETLKYVIDKGAETDINVYTCASITKGLKGEEIVDMDYLKGMGAAGFTDDGIPLLEEGIARAAMEKAVATDSVLSFHEEDPSYITNNGVNRGIASDYYGIGGSDRMAEISMVERDIRLALETGAKVNFQHISTKEAIDLIRDAKQDDRGVNIHAEATPHHISMTEKDVIEHGTLAKMNPPLRTEEDRQAILAGLADGTIDLIATDHAPHSEEEKAKEITGAPSGIIGLETALPVCYNSLVKNQTLSKMQLFCKMSTNPARMYGIMAGELAIDRTADLVIFDENRVKTFDKPLSKSKNSPLLNCKITGDIIMTICRGKIVYENLE